MPYLRYFVFVFVKGVEVILLNFSHVFVHLILEVLYFKLKN